MPSSANEFFFHSHNVDLRKNKPALHNELGLFHSYICVDLHPYQVERTGSSTIVKQSWNSMGDRLGIEGGVRLDVQVV